MTSQASWIKRASLGNQPCCVQAILDYLQWFTLEAHFVHHGWSHIKAPSAVALGAFMKAKGGVGVISDPALP